MSQPRLPTGFRWVDVPVCDNGCHPVGPAVMCVDGVAELCLNCGLKDGMPRDQYLRLKDLKPRKYVLMISDKPYAVVSTKAQGKRVFNEWCDTFKTVDRSRLAHWMSFVELEYHKPNA